MGAGWVQATNNKASAAVHPIEMGRLIFMGASICKLDLRCFMRGMLSLLCPTTRTSCNHEETISLTLEPLLENQSQHDTYCIKLKPTVRTSRLWILKLHPSLVTLVVTGILNLPTLENADDVRPRILSLRWMKKSALSHNSQAQLNPTGVETSRASRLFTPTAGYPLVGLSPAIPYCY